MSKVIAINDTAAPEPGVPDKDIVELLELHLADAKSGKTVAVAVCSVGSAGRVLGSFSMTSHRFTLLGVMSNLIHKLNARVAGGD